MKYGELMDQMGERGNRAILLCPDCASKYSAHAADYWSMPKDEDILCGECGAKVVRVLKVVTYVDA